jgi:RyR domain
MTTTTAVRLSDEQVARIAYDTVRAHQAAWGDPVNPPWDEAGEQARASALAALQVGRTTADPVARHAAWVRYRTAEGWRPGPTKDVLAWTHPWLVPYDQLPKRAQDRGRIYAALAAAFD